MEPRAFKPKGKAVHRSAHFGIMCEKCGEKFKTTPLWSKHMKGCTATTKPKEPSVMDKIVASIREKNK